MKELLLLPALFAVFIFGFFIVKQVDKLIEENQRQIAAEHRKQCCNIRIAAETPMLLNSVAPAMDYCSGMLPYMEFSVSSGRAGRLRSKLLNGSIDMALLTEDSIKDFCGDFGRIKIPRRQSGVMVEGIPFPIEELDTEKYLYILWNRKLPSPNRDRVLFVLETDPDTLKYRSSNA